MLSSGAEDFGEHVEEMGYWRLDEDVADIDGAKVQRTTAGPLPDKEMTEDAPCH